MSGAVVARDRGGGGREDDGSAPTRASAITITDFKFTPAAITVASGAKVTLTNEGRRRGKEGEDASGSIVAPPAGTYPFHCTIHPFMTGRLVAH